MQRPPLRQYARTGLGTSRRMAPICCTSSSLICPLTTGRKRKVRPGVFGSLLHFIMRNRTVFRIGPVADDRLEACLGNRFNMSGGDLGGYCKVFINEPGLHDFHS